MTKISYIVDTDPWYDPDDLFALLFLVNSNITPDLIVTGDEVSDKRAQLTTWFLGEIGLPKTKIIAGKELPGKTRLFCSDLIENKQYNVSGKVVEEIKKVVEGSDRTVYIGIQACSNLAAFHTKYPELCDKISLYQMGGALTLPLEKAEHNFRIDIPSAQQIISSGIETHLIMLDTTINPAYEISNKHQLYSYCKESTNSGIKAIAQNIDEFNATVRFWTHMHDPLTVSVALGQTFVDFEKAKVSIDDKGFLRLNENGKEIYVSKPQSKDKEFMNYFTQIITGGKQ